MKPLILLGSFLVGVVGALFPWNTNQLTLRDAVEVIAEYEVHHPEVPYSTQWYGVTDFENRKIYVIKNTELSQRRKTAIHEMIHAARKIRGQFAGTNEEEELLIQQATAMLYQELFGVSEEQ